MKRLWNRANSTTGGSGQHAGTGENPAVRVGLAPGEVAHVVGQRHGERLHVLLLGDQERPQELVPRPDEGEQDDGQQCRLDQRRRHEPQHRQLAGAVDARGVEEFTRHGAEELPEYEHGDGADGERQDHAEVRVGRDRTCARSGRTAGSSAVGTARSVPAARCANTVSRPRHSSTANA